MTENKKVYPCKICHKLFNSRATEYRHRLKCQAESEKTALQEQANKEVEMKDKVISELERNNQLEEQVTALQQENKEQNERINSLEMQLSSLKDMMKIVLQNNTTHSYVSQPPTQVEAQAPAPVKPFSTKGYLNEECKNALSVEEVKNRFKTNLEPYLKGENIDNIPRDDTPLIKWVINKSLEGIKVDNFPIRCSSKKLKHFWGKKNDGDNWEKGFDAIDNFYKPMCYAVISLIILHRKQNPHWIDNDKMSEKSNNLFIALSRTMDKEENIKKSTNFLIEKTIILKE